VFVGGLSHPEVLVRAPVAQGGGSVRCWALGALVGVGGLVVAASTTGAEQISSARVASAASQLAADRPLAESALAGASIVSSSAIVHPT